MNSMIFSQNYTHDEIAIIAQKLYALKNTCPVYAFIGEVGAGKTTLIATLLQLFGVNDFEGSPTYTYVNIYTVRQNSTMKKLYHFDLYRLRSAQDFAALGFTDYLQESDAKSSWSFIEWPEVIMPIYKPVCVCTLEHIDETMRKITVEQIII